MASLSPFSQNLGVKRAAHLLRRATFGGTKTQIDQFSQLTPAEAINQLFTEPAAREAPRDPATGADWVSPKPTENNSGRDELIAQTKAWWIDSFLQSAPCVATKSSFFLHTHFTTISTRLRHAPSIYYQIRLFDKFAQGNFKELTKCICLDNAMMRHLDGQLNRKGSPNENYAREFLELYSIGKGPQRGADDYTTFTELDVVEAAKVFSGYFPPDCFTAEGIGFLAHGVPLNVVVQQVDDLFGDGVRIAEGHDSATTVGKHLGGVPVGRRNDGLARAHGVGKGPGGDLGFFEIRGNVNIGNAEEFTQLLEFHEPVLENDLLADIEFAHELLQHDPIGISL